jgi:plastocyanin
MKAGFYRAAAALALLLTGAVALHGAPVRVQAAAAPARTKTIHIKAVDDKYGFHPTKLTVATGTKVTWVNNSDAPHTVTGKGSWKFSSNTFSQGQKLSKVFTKAGTYHYYCAVHPYMQATIVVKKGM